MKRFLALFLFVTLLAPLLPEQAFAGGGEEKGSGAYTSEHTDDSVRLFTYAYAYTTVTYDLSFSESYENPSPGVYIIRLSVTETGSTPDATNSGAQKEYILANPVLGANTVTILTEPSAEPPVPPEPPLTPEPPPAPPVGDFNSENTFYYNGSSVYANGEVLIKWKDGASAEAIAQTHGLLVKDTFLSLRIARLTTKSDEKTKDLVAKLSGDPSLEYAEPNYFRGSNALPNDPLFSSQWGLHNTGQLAEQEWDVVTPDADIDAPEAWDIATKTNPITVAVLDTGIMYTHQDLKNRMWNGGGSCYDEHHVIILDGCPNHGWNFVNSNNDPMDNWNHGTPIAGIIGAERNNGLGIAGVAENVYLMAVQIGNQYNGVLVSDEIKGILFAANNGARVINASFSGQYESQAEKDAISFFPGLFVTSAGNGWGYGFDGGGSPGKNNDVTPSYPSQYDLPNLVSVAATDENDQLASFSNYGQTSVDIAAPGSNIQSTDTGQTANLSIYEDFYSVIPPSSGSQFTAVGETPTWGPRPYSLPDWNEEGNELAGDVNNIPYLPDNRATVRSNPLNIDSNEVSTAILNLRVFCDTDEDGGNDHLMLRMGDNMKTEITAPFHETMIRDSGGEPSGKGMIGWFGYDITPYIASPFQFELEWVTDSENIVPDDYTGCAIQRVVLWTAGVPGTNYGLNYGTSFAAAHVSGEAAVLLSINPWLTPEKLKEIIESTGDEKESLVGKIKTGKRINLFNAVTEVTTNLPSVVLSNTPASQTSETGASITVGGENVSLYQWSLDNAPLSSDTLIENPISLANLSIGVHTLRVLGKNRNGIPQLSGLIEFSWTVVEPPPPPALSLGVSGAPPPAVAGSLYAPRPIQPKVLGEQAQLYPDGTILKLKGKKTYYIIYKGKKMKLTAAKFKKLSKGKKVVEVDRKTLKAIPDYKKSKK